MLKNIGKTLTITFALTIFISAFSFGQEKQDSSNKNIKMHKMEMKKDHKAMDMKDSIVRKGVIDLKSIDKNKDGKVYQCQMDYNVISDKPGKDPLCGMKLKEVSIKKAKRALIKAGFKVK